MTTAPPQTAQVVVLDFDDLVADPSTATRAFMQRAFGPDGVGLIAIRNVPKFTELKHSLLSQAHTLAHLPEDELQKLEDVDSLYNAGWSHGKEKLKADTPDWNKASFYFNPLIDVPGTEQDRQQYPYSYPCNRWPSSRMPDLEPAAKRLGSLMKDVAVLLSKHIDDYAHSVHPTSYQPSTLYDSLKNTEKAKGRLLYYFPLVGTPNDTTDGNHQIDSEDSWIGWHNDSGFLTCLSGGLFLQPDGTILPKSPDPSAGLYVVDRQDHVIKVELPADCMGIQIGECTQILTNGAVVATPHCVRGIPGVARTSMACFIDTPPGYRLSSPSSEDDNHMLLAQSSSRVPPLSKRWTNGMTFGDFLAKTFQMYYEFDNQ
ncbi:2-oxoglutarate/Fe(II)-dependent dioxygenase [Nitzschia inconspicua]|uniref:2-oxoglutarate/Fe(II)-dependent dioxygenase n=1 Tax=Nitzschia inconspicua TaxID=303405 RepID=A0A9K3Q783_9STRA|nr:2-oxoglutarate/Fe(II)-dependent dioxygenase [Nitzschia inconspicua]